MTFLNVVRLNKTNTLVKAVESNLNTTHILLVTATHFRTNNYTNGNKGVCKEHLICDIDILFFIVVDVVG